MSKSTPQQQLPPSNRNQSRRPCYCLLHVPSIFFFFKPIQAKWKDMPVVLLLQCWHPFMAQLVDGILYLTQTTKLGVLTCKLACVQQHSCAQPCIERRDGSANLFITKKASPFVSVDIFQFVICIQ